MRIYTGIKYALVLSVAFGCLAAMVFASVIPVLLLRYWVLPTDWVGIPLDFVRKAVQQPTLGAARTTEQLVAMLDLRAVAGVAAENYAIKLDLVLPRSQTNRDLGNFAVKASLGEADWHTAHREKHAESVQRMALLPFRSEFTETLVRVLGAPCYVSGLCHEQSRLHFELWPAAVKPKHRNPHLLLTLPAELMVAEASLSLEVRLTGLKHLLKQYPVLSTLALSSLVFWSELVGGAVFGLWVYAQVASNRPQKQPPRGEWLSVLERSRYGTHKEPVLSRLNDRVAKEARRGEAKTGVVKRKEQNSKESTKEAETEVKEAREAEAEVEEIEVKEAEAKAKKANENKAKGANKTGKAGNEAKAEKEDRESRPHRSPNRPPHRPSLTHHRTASQTVQIPVEVVSPNSKRERKVETQEVAVYVNDGDETKVDKIVEKPKQRKGASGENRSSEKTSSDKTSSDRTSSEKTSVEDSSSESDETIEPGYLTPAYD